MLTGITTPLSQLLYVVEGYTMSLPGGPSRPGHKQHDARNPTPTPLKKSLTSTAPVRAADKKRQPAVPAANMATLAPRIECRRFQTDVRGWASTVLHMHNVHLSKTNIATMQVKRHRRNDVEIVITVPHDYVANITQQIQSCKIDGYIANAPTFIVRGGAVSCLRSGMAPTILVDTVNWGTAYYDSLVDQLLPWFITREKLRMKTAVVQFYASDGKHERVDPKSRLFRNLMAMAECFGLRFNMKISIRLGCYESASVGFLYQYRPVHATRDEMAEGKVATFAALTYVDEMAEWLRKSSKRLRSCRALPAELKVTKPWALVQRNNIGTFELLPSSVARIPDSQNINWTSVRGLVAVEGATFANQLLMLPNSTLVQLHLHSYTLYGEIPVVTTPPVWHSSIAQYLGHTNVDVLLPADFIDGQKLEGVLESCKSLAPQQFCVSTNLQLPLECRTPQNSVHVANQSKQAFALRPAGGLCNRLRVILSYRLHCKNTGQKLIVEWEPDIYCPGHFLEFFQELPGVTFVGSLDRFADYDGAYPHREHNTTSMFRALKLKPLLRKRIDDTVQKMGDYVAVHMRRTDQTYSIKDSPDEVFYEFLSRFPSNPIYVATDNERTYAQMQTKYAHRIPLPWHQLVNKGSKWAEMNGLQHARMTSLADAIVDIWVCARARKFHPSEHSSFSDTILSLRELGNYSKI